MPGRTVLSTSRQGPVLLSGSGPTTSGRRLARGLARVGGSGLTLNNFERSFSVPRAVDKPVTSQTTEGQGGGTVADDLKSLEHMRKFSERYAKNSGTYFCSDPSVTAVVIKGLAEHKDTVGAPLCPCRHYDDKEAEVAQGFWNCPCVPMRERMECHCMLFLTEDNPFRADDAKIGLQEIKDLTDNPQDI